MNEDKYRAKLMESLVHLYLRLNGFFLTRLIIHSPSVGENRTEVDALGLRMPFHAQPDTTVPSDCILDLSEARIDLVICEVKGKGQKLQFNRALKTRQSVELLLRWSGLLRSGEIPQHIDEVLAALTGPDKPVVLASSFVPGGQVRIRGLLFCPERHTRRQNQPFFITGSDILGHIHRCLVPDEPRESCATRYDFSLWGEHESIVRHFKQLNRDSSTTFDELCRDPMVRSYFTQARFLATSIENTVS